MATLDAVLAYAVLDHIEAHPDAWNQARWIEKSLKSDCGTAGCFAGWTVMLKGYEPFYESLYPGSVREEGRRVLMPDGSLRPVWALAEELLGARLHRFTDDSGEPDEEDLFAEWHTLEDLRRLVREIFGPRPESMPARA